MLNQFFEGAYVTVFIATSDQCHDFFIATAVRKSYINSSECALRSMYLKKK